MCNWHVFLSVIWNRSCYTEKRCISLLCPALKAHISFSDAKTCLCFVWSLYPKCRRIHGGRYGLNGGSVQAPLFINQSQIHFALLKGVSGSVNTWILKALMPRWDHAILLTKRFRVTATSSGQRGVWNPAWRLTWCTSHWGGRIDTRGL